MRDSMLWASHTHGITHSPPAFVFAAQSRRVRETNTNFTQFGHGGFHFWAVREIDSRKLSVRRKCYHLSRVNNNNYCFLLIHHHYELLNHSQQFKL